MNAFPNSSDKLFRFWLFTVLKIVRSVGRGTLFRKMFCLDSCLLVFTKNARRNDCRASRQMFRYFCSTVNAVEADQQILVKFGVVKSCRSPLYCSRFTCGETDGHTWRRKYAQCCNFLLEGRKNEWRCLNIRIHQSERAYVFKTCRYLMVVFPVFETTYPLGYLQTQLSLVRKNVLLLP